MAYAPTAQAKFVIDVTPTTSTSLNGTATIGGGFVVTNTQIQPTGTGVIDPFLTIQQNGHERGYNTDGALNLDQKRSGGGFTRSLQLNEIPIVMIGGVAYREFGLDVNQQANGPISLNQVQIFQTSSQLPGSGFTLTEATQGTGANQVGGNDALIQFGSLNPIFQMNNLQNTLGNLSTNNEVQIDSGHGSGSGDMFYYVRDSLFGANANDYITLFSQFGQPNGTYDSNAGFEEWWVREGNNNPGGGGGGGDTGNPVPAPAGLVLIASALPMLGLRRVFRRKAAAN